MENSGTNLLLADLMKYGLRPCSIHIHFSEYAPEFSFFNLMNSRPAGDDHALDLGSAFVYLSDFGVTHHAFYWVVSCKAIATK